MNSVNFKIFIWWIWRSEISDTRDLGIIFIIICTFAYLLDLADKGFIFCLSTHTAFNTHLIILASHRLGQMNSNEIDFSYFLKKQSKNLCFIIEWA